MKLKIKKQQALLLEDLLLNVFYGLPVMRFTELDDRVGEIIDQLQAQLYGEDE